MFQITLAKTRIQSVGNHDRVHIGESGTSQFNTDRYGGMLLMFPTQISEIQFQNLNGSIREISYVGMNLAS